jgi:3-oxoacyl-[acyl-carrier protein] reductase
MRRAFITGAGRGIGFAIAKKLESEGCEVVTPSRKDFDLGDTAAVERYLNKNFNLEVDILVNNAGENKIEKIESLSLEDWLRIQNVNMNAVFLLTQFFARKMIAKKQGHILNVASIYSFLGRPGRAAYATSKGGLNGFTRVCALEFGPSNVIVNSLSPGFVDTELTRKNNSPDVIRGLEEQTALKRMATTAEIAEFASFLVSPRNTYITGQNLIIDGGFSIQ